MMDRPIPPNAVMEVTPGVGDLITIRRYDGRKQEMQPVPKRRPPDIVKPDKPYGFWLGAAGWGYEG
jgi:hypothetical protein